MTVCITGASGLVGSELLIQLLKNEEIEKILVLTRGPIGFGHPKMQIVPINFDHLDQLKVEEKMDVGFCCLGTTLKKAGSKEAQIKVDSTYVTAFAAFCKRSGVNRFGVVSSIGANPESTNFYLNTKGKMEQGVLAIDFDHTVITRPSFLKGSRKEFRIGEKLAAFFLFIFYPIMQGGLKKYRGVNASDVALQLANNTFNTIEKQDIQYPL